MASAAPITLPSGLNSGDTYFLAFVTAGARDATSSNIADYDAFVTAQANSDPVVCPVVCLVVSCGEGVMTRR